jgi:hypothetical protein
MNQTIKLFYFSFISFLLQFNTLTWGQTTLISPTGDGGFETSGAGTVFANNGWTVINGNNGGWYVNTGTVINGSYTFASSSSRSIFFSNNTGTNWRYNTSPVVGSSCFYKDVTFPSGQVSNLSFRWNAYGETSWDVFYIYLCPQTLTPVANSPSSSTSTVSWTGTGTATLVFTSSLLSAGGGQTNFIPITTAMAGNTSANSLMRLVFVWKNDASGGSEPPLAIDDINLITYPSNAMSGTYTIDNTSGNSSTNFSSFSDAIVNLNARGISGAVTFNVSASETFQENPPVLTATGTSTNTITFQKSGVGNNPKITPTGSTGTTDAGIAINGGDYITFDGIDIDASAGTAVEFGYYLYNSSTTNGAQYNTIKNCAINLGNRTNANSCYGISQNTGNTPASAAGANSYNKYYNLTISNVKTAGLYLNSSGGSTSPDLSCEVGTTSCATRNSITSIGSTSSTLVSARGIYAYGQSGLKLWNNDISAIAGDQAATQGIYFTNCLGATNEIYANKIQNISVKGSTTTTSIAYGIQADMGTNASSSVKIYNNFISNIYTSFTSTATANRYAMGLYTGITSNPSTQTFEIDNNSISVGQGLTPTYSNACFEIFSSTPVYKVRGNIFANFTGAQGATAKHFGIVATSAGIGGTNTVFDYNDYFIANDQSTSGHVGRNNTTSTNYSLIADWNAFTTGTLDETSISIAPTFVNNNTDLHASASGLDAVSGFTAQSWVTSDIDCETRSSFTPSDLGADCFTSSACTTPANQATSLQLTSVTSSSLQGSFTAAASLPSGYLVVRSTSNSLSANPVNTTSYSAGNALGGGVVIQSSASTTFSQSSLTDNTTYYYFIFSYNNSGCSGGPLYNVATPLTGSTATCLATPSTLSVTSITSTGFTAGWGTVAGATDYTIDVSTNSGFSPVISGSPFTSITNSFALTGLVSGNTYYYRVTATGGSCNSAISNSANTTLTCSTPSAQATSLSISAATTASITGSFAAATGSPTGYLVVISTSSTLNASPLNGTSYSSGASLGGGIVVGTPGSSTSISATGLTAGTQYYFFVYTYNNTTCSGGPVYNTTSPLSASYWTCPSAPSTPTFSSINSSGMTVNWGSVIGAASYSLEVSTNSGFTAPISGSPFTVAGTSQTLTGLTSGNTYYSRVTAVGPNCNSAVSTAANTLLACETPTSLSNGITFNSAGETTIGASFSTATIAPTSYLVIRTSTNSMPTPTNGNTYTVGSNALGYIEYVSNSAGSWNSTLLTPGTTYYYWIFSYNSGSCSGPVYSSLATNASATTSSCASFNSTILINGGNAVSGVSYPTISSAILALNACGGITQPTIFELTSGYVNELTNNTLTLPSIAGMSGTNTITIRPASGVNNLEIISSVAGATIAIDGGDYWIIDGRPGGSGSPSSLNLAISNTSTATSGMAIQITNDAIGNVIRYSNLKASFGSGTSGVIVLAGGTTNVTGNDNNTIEFNNISGNGLVFNGIYCAGTTNVNDNAVIQNNNVYDFFNAGNATNGINISSNNNSFTINNNAIYQTVARTYTTGATHTGILINNTSGNNFSVNGNQIGGGFSVNGGPTPANKYTIAGTIANRYKAISIAVGTTTVTSVQSNTIAGFDFTSSTGANTTGGPWCGIYVSAGKVNIGNSSGNTIGSSSGIGSILINVSTSGAISSGINVETIASDFNISNNAIGSITTTGSTTSIAHGFTGIATQATGVVTISNNVIGSTSTSNSISASNAATTTTSFQYLNGILNTGNSTVLNISNNTIANLNNAYVPSAFQSTINSIICGISSSAGTATITGNTVRNFTANANATNTGLKASVVGISVTSNAGATVSQNVIHSLNSSNMAGTTISVTGIAYSGATTGTNVIERNRIYNLNNTSPTSGRVHGIFIVAGNANVHNNMIRLGYDVSGSSITTPISIYGIFEAGGTNNYYHNSMYVGGSNVTSNTTIPSTAAFYCSSATGTRSILNNIFVNARSNSAATGGPKNYAIYLPSTVTGLTSNYNIFQATGIGSVFGAISGGDRADFTAWKASSSAPDANSINANPLFLDPTNATIPDLHINQNLNSPADRSGTIVAAVTTDFDGQTRSAFSAVDIGADAFIKTIIWSNQSWSNTTGPTQYDNAEIQDNLVLNQNLSANNLSIISSFVVTVNPNIVLSIKENLINNGQIIFKSNVSGSGLFDTFTGTVTGSGSTQVERYIPARRAYRFLSPSVTTSTSIRNNWQEDGGTTSGLGTHITGAGGATNGFDNTSTNNPSLFSFDNTTGAWIAVTNTNSNTLSAGTAYRLMVRGDRLTDLTTNTPTSTVTTLRTTGVLKTGNHSPTLNQASEGYSFVGNPYQAPVDIKAVLATSTNMNSGLVYYWDPTLNIRGAYVTRDLTTDNNSIASSFNQYLQPGQAVFVKKAATASAASMLITENNKSVTNSAAGVFRTTTTNFGTIRTNLRASIDNQWTTIEGALAVFNPTYSWDVTQEDANKFSNLDEEVSFMQNNTSLAIACQPNPSTTNELPIRLNNTRYTNYQWQFELGNYSGPTPYLFDTQNNTYTQIDNNTIVPFTVNGQELTRFKIVFQNGTLSTPYFSNRIVLYPNPGASGQTSFNIEGITEAQVALFTLLGQKIPVKTEIIGKGMKVISKSSLSKGIYLVMVNQDSKTSYVKWIVE